MLFVEVIGDRALPDELDRDDVEEALIEAVGSTGEITGAGTGQDRWHLDLEIEADDLAARAALLRAARALVAMDLGWIILRPEGQERGMSAADLAR